MDEDGQHDQGPSRRLSAQELASSTGTCIETVANEIELVVKT
jgi:hypothetical protein